MILFCHRRHNVREGAFDVCKIMYGLDFSSSKTLSPRSCFFIYWNILGPPVVMARFVMLILRFWHQCDDEIICGYFSVLCLRSLHVCGSYFTLFHVVSGIGRCALLFWCGMMMFLIGSWEEVPHQDIQPINFLLVLLVRVVFDRGSELFLILMSVYSITRTTCSRRYAGSGKHRCVF